MDEEMRRILASVTAKELGVNISSEGPDNKPEEKKEPTKRFYPETRKSKTFDDSYDKYSPEDNSPFSVSYKNPKGYMPPETDIPMEQFLTLFDEEYKDKVELYKRIHVVKEAFMEVFNNCVDIFFKQVRHKHGNSGVIFVPKRYIGNRCTVIVWPREGEEPRIKSVKETMFRMKEAQDANKERNNS